MFEVLFSRLFCDFLSLVSFWARITSPLKIESRRLFPVPIPPLLFPHVSRILPKEREGEGDPPFAFYPLSNFLPIRQLIDRGRVARSPGERSDIFLEQPYIQYST